MHSTLWQSDPVDRAGPKCAMFVVGGERGKRGGKEKENKYEWKK